MWLHILDALTSARNWIRRKRNLSRDNTRLRREVRDLTDRLSQCRKAARMAHRRDARRAADDKADALDAKNREWQARLDHELHLKDEEIESLKMQLQAAIDSLDRISAANTVEAARYRAVLQERNNGGVVQR